MFKVRTTAPVYPEPPYNWNAATKSKFQCTWYCYYRAQEVGFTPPCYGDRATKTYAYTNAKEWLKNFREPWEVKGPDYKPVPGDIAVFDGHYGHVVFIEKSDGTISEYNRVVKNEFNIDVWKFGGPLAGCGPLLGYLHFPNNPVNPVARNEKVDQIQTTDPSLRIRLEPSLEGEIYGNVQLGYYNVLSKTEADGYIWYEIAKGKYCANVSTVFLPADNEERDLLKEIEEYLEATMSKIESLDEEILVLKDKLEVINEISGGM